MEPIKFYIGQESGIVVENKDFDKSLFAEQYKQTFEIFNQIWNAQTNDDFRNASNIIAFCGDRGEGKSSLLTSVRGILKDKETLSNACQDLKISSKEPWNDIETMEIVDPTFFDENHNLIELVLGQMYNRVAGPDVDASNIDICRRRNLMIYFQKAKQCLSALVKERAAMYDEIEELSTLGANVNLQQAINQLFQEYLTYLNKKKLLICIDDLDLSLGEGYKMAEEMRKYLFQSTSCILLVAVNVEQLERVISSFIRAQLKPSAVSMEMVEIMARQYVNKLIPLNRRVLMPKGGTIVTQKLILIDDKTPYEPKLPIKEFVVDLIFKKTRYVFVNGRHLNPIVPTNLRDLRHLIASLWELPDADYDSFAENQPNRDVFKRYFYETWVKCLCSSDRNFVSELVSNTDISSLNKQVVKYLSLIISKDNIELPELSPSTKLFKKIVDSQNTFYNVSYGDVCYALRQVEQSNIDRCTELLIFFIKTFYSINLYELYNDITINETHLYPQQDNKTKSIYKLDPLLQQQNLLQRLLNGGYFTYNQGDLITLDKYGNGKDLRPINASSLWSLFDDIKKKNNTIDIRKLQCCEFFALTTTRSLKTTRQGELLVDYDRTQYDPLYLAPYERTTNYLLFDVMSVFYNLINVRATYQRFSDIFGDDFYEFAAKTRGSLLNQILDKYVSNIVWDDSSLDSITHAFISDVSIRFSDVQQAIIECAMGNKFRHRVGDIAANWSWLYRDTKGLEITLYPLRDGEKSHTLKFDYLQPLIDFLDGEVISSDSKKKKGHLYFQNIISTKGIVIGGGFSASEDDIKRLDNVFGKDLCHLCVDFPKKWNALLIAMTQKYSFVYSSLGGKSFWEGLADSKMYYYLEELYDILAPYSTEILNAKDLWENEQAQQLMEERLAKEEKEEQVRKKSEAEKVKREAELANRKAIEEEKLLSKERMQKEANDFKLKQQAQDLAHKRELEEMKIEERLHKNQMNKTFLKQFEIMKEELLIEIDTRVKNVQQFSAEDMRKIQSLIQIDAEDQKI